MAWRLVAGIGFSILAWGGKPKRADPARIAKRDDVRRDPHHAWETGGA
jgi:hypothetical protein